MTYQVPLFINGQFITSASTITQPVINPATQEVLAELPMATVVEIDQAVAGARQAFKSWKDVPVPERARLMMRYQALLKEHHDELAELLAKDTGKTFEDAKGDVWRGIEVVEQAANIPALLMGETVGNVAGGIDTSSYLQPLGVCVGITPFNFPAMIPLWMFPLAVACGNTFILKPSEQVPLTPVRLLELLVKAGIPDGVVQLVHGGQAQVERLLEHPDTRAISFVGSANVAQSIYRTGTSHMKRVQCMAGAKNHCVIMPDADKEQALNQLVGASVGAAGQRCMAISVAVFVGQSKAWIPELADKLSTLRPGAWDDTGAAFGPVISKAAKTRITGLIQQGKQEATCLLDGTDCKVENLPDGNWVGPTLFTDVTPDMAIYQQEIFGPVLCCVCVDSLEEAIQLVNRNPYGNGTSIFTRSGGAARKYQHEIEVGQVGINVPIPVPLPFFSFTGWKGSFMGDLHAYGKQAVRFYTETKTVTTRWLYDDEETSGQPNLTINLK
ncbi:CoA-acylating methylmalonate-semialdehyde dehydrogenase [Endozoicomonas gorgoniicola]|uniref:methylmalonate-semialdehyde dehydrogenase (CoA acylating) n=1 Tax=Endozoicomonas gorgoniicola TaxID=1234144 RepID=A0ABT3MU76_9GAMM|nr:CoA-acylating methylmalonate-semialdehyde dehydrogenase [Endozoicomonas gorgoniicola]MCW7552628.1 CoA-acylating methylmalonate-semialdehyde dehydrogenase [Endozoicomonas gorgoniicola]